MGSGSSMRCVLEGDRHHVPFCSVCPLLEVNPPGIMDCSDSVFFHNRRRGSNFVVKKCTHYYFSLRQ